MAQDIHMRCVLALMERYKGINKADGYHNDIVTVTWGKMLIHDNRPTIVDASTEEEDYPFISVDEQDVAYPEDNSAVYPNMIATLNMTATIFLYGIADEFTTMHEARMDLQRATDFSRPLVENRILQRKSFGPRVLLINPRDESPISSVTLQMSISLKTIMGVDYELAESWWKLKDWK